MQIDSFDLKKCIECAEQAFKQKFGRMPQFEVLEKKFGNLKGTNKALSYSQIKNLTKRKYWDFEDYWTVPGWRIIRKRLKETKGIFIDLPNDERNATNVLFKIFKNIEVVSIILRFVDPQNFGIISPPVRYAIEQAPSENYLDEYLDYISILRSYAREYSFQNVADTEVAIWSLVEKCINQQGSSCPNFEQYQEKLIENEENNIKKSLYCKNLIDDLREKEDELNNIKAEFKNLEEERKKLDGEILSDAEKQIKLEKDKAQEEIKQLKSTIKELDGETKKSEKLQGIFKHLLILEPSSLSLREKLQYRKKEPPVDSGQWVFMERLGKHPYVNKIIWNVNVDMKPPSRIHKMDDKGELTVYYVGRNNYTAKIRVYPCKETDRTNAIVFARLLARHMGMKEPKIDQI